MKTLLETAQKEHYKKLYKIFQNLQGTLYKYDFGGGLEFCIEVENENPKIDIRKNTYTFTISPTNQWNYNSVNLKSLSLENCLDLVNHIALRQKKQLWKYYFMNGGVKKERN